jgi:hypothetical protein
MSAKLVSRLRNSIGLVISSGAKVHRSCKEGIAKLSVVIHSAGRHLRNETKQ